MNFYNNPGKLLIYIGFILVIIGIVFNYAGNIFSWFGNLPGDIHIKKKNVSVFFPISSLIIISVLLNLILYIIRKLF